MGVVVQLNDYRSFTAEEEMRANVTDSLVPVELAVGLPERRACLKKVAEYGIRDIEIHRLSAEPDALLYLMGVRDAIWLNKKILERENISDEEIAQRIDLIQMLENANLPLLQAMWQSFTSRDAASC